MVKTQPLEENQKSAVETITSQVRQSSADIKTFAQGTIKELNKKDGNAKLLTGNDFNDEHIINAAISILNQSKIYAIPVKGIYLSQKSKAELNSFLAVFNGKNWIYINPKHRWSRVAERFSYLAIRNEPIFNVIGAKKLNLL